MKNIIIAMFCLLTFSPSFGQDTKPTKQETMDWIGNTLLKYKNTTPHRDHYGEIEYANFSYSNGFLSYTYIFTMYNQWGKIESKSKELRTINLNKALTLNYSYGSYVLVGSNIVKVKEENEPFTYLNSFSICIACDSNQSEFIIVDENNIKERLWKAINALLEYNKSQQPKEAY